MSTRGTFGVVIDGQTKAGYNHCDSYPDYLGRHVIRDIRELLEDHGHIDKVKELARNLKSVSDDTPPTKEDIETLAQFTDLSVGNQTTEEWYNLLRNLQGELKQTLVTGYIDDDGGEFLKDSLFCEYGYLANLDTQKLEIYKGFQKTKPTKTRYQTDEPDPQGFWPCELVMEVSFSDILLEDTDALTKHVAMTVDPE